MKESRSKRERSKVASLKLDDCPTALARVVESGAELNWKVKDLVEVVKGAYPDVEERKLRRWREDVRDHGFVGTTDDKRGAEKCLTFEQSCLMVGWILYRNFEKLPPDRLLIEDWVRKEFGVSMEKTTTRRYLAEGFISLKLLKKKTAGYQVEASEMVKVAADWIRAHHVMLSRLPKHLGVFVDYCTDQYRTVRPKRYGPVGG
jgi:hypothetical protein